MGNSQNRVGIRLEKQNYVAGDVLKGRVYLSKAAKDRTLDWVGLSLLLEGIEHVEGAEKQRADNEHDRDSRTPQYVVHRLRDPIFRTEYPLAETSSHGQREYPFELPLPADLPSSMRCQKDGKRFCEVQYSLSVLMYDRNRQLLQQDTVCFGVTADRSQMTSQPVHMDEEIFPIKFCCCNDKGVIAMGLDCDRNLANVSGGNFRVEVRGRNCSSQRVEALSIKLVEIVRWRVPGLKKEIKEQNTLAKQKTSVDMIPQWRPTYKGKYMLGDESSPPQSSNMKVPHFARDSYEGRNLSVRHMLVVTAKTEGGCVTNPDLSTPVRLIRTRDGSIPSAETVAIPYVEAQVLPENWQAVEEDLIHVPLASAVVIDDGASTNTRTPTTHPVPSAPSEAYDRSRAANDLASIVVSNPENLAPYLQNPALRAPLRTLSPRDYSRLLEAAGPPHLRTVAPALASHMNFATRHLLSSMFSFPAYRVLLLETTALYAADFAEHHALVEQELDASELAHFRRLVDQHRQRGKR